MRLCLFLCIVTFLSLGWAGNTLEGVASWYGEELAGNLTANGEIFNPGELTAAHLTLPFDTRVKVINPANDSYVIVRINDRGPYAHGRIIDLSRAAAAEIDMVKAGVAQVALEVLGDGDEAALESSSNDNETLDTEKQEDTPEIPVELTYVASSEEVQPDEGITETSSNVNVAGDVPSGEVLELSYNAPSSTPSNASSDNASHTEDTETEVMLTEETRNPTDNDTDSNTGEDTPPAIAYIAAVEDTDNLVITDNPPIIEQIVTIPKPDIRLEVIENSVAAPPLVSSTPSTPTALPTATATQNQHRSLENLQHYEIATPSQELSQEPPRILRRADILTNVDALRDAAYALRPLHQLESSH